MRSYLCLSTNSYKFNITRFQNEKKIINEKGCVILLLGSVDKSRSDALFINQI
jgi:hypothetical protein